MRRKIFLKTFILLIVVASFLSCSHMPKNIKGKEKVVLVHGFGRSPKAMSDFGEFLESKGYQVYRVGYSSLTQDIEGIKEEFSKKVDKFIISTDDRVHFVGHSMGGLLIRSYLGEKTPRGLGNVVIMGSPSKGTPVVDHYKKKWYFSLAGPALKSLSASGSKFLKSLKKPDYNLGVIAGVVDRPSKEHILPGKDDGLVPFESTKVEGSKDFMVFNVSHYMLRYDQHVMDQVHFFLKNSKFIKI